ncbi:GAF domain-containing protein [Candidatus Chloroploca sp. M-50]|uniref:histidine kinase n=1 Tax=Candidatus Chloroploca mongolica TaxID=2528176 RepID=A0ABS4D6T6_9CHLR|nr:ATP-binding protein [Candidatus Chloroploca mongolica]MBP1465154.1 GAF domain-containing protein [Candidatus Chloroploca mongolica]
MQPGEADILYSFSPQALLDALFAFVGVVTFDGILIEANQSALKVAGLQPSDVIGKPFHETYWWSYDPDVQAELCLALARGQAGETSRYDVMVRVADERLMMIDFMLAPLRDAYGNIRYLIPSAIDVSERYSIQHEREFLLARERIARQMAEQAVRRVERLQVITSALSEAVTPLDVARVVVEEVRQTLDAHQVAMYVRSADGTALEVLHSTNAPPTGDSAPVPITMLLDTTHPLGETLKTALPVFLVSQADREALYQSVTLPPPLAADAHGLALLPLEVEGQVMGVCMVSFAEPRQFPQDERAFLWAIAVQCAQALQRARLYSTMQEAVTTRDHFIAVASHDLRTPLTVMLGQAQLLDRRMQHAQLGEAFTRPIQAIVQQSLRLNRMLTSLLDLSRIQTGQLVIERDWFDLRRLVERIVAEVSPTLSRHTLELLATPDPLPIFADELRIEEVIQNIISNAIKYSPAGGPILLTLEQRDEHLCVAISDQGIGIPLEAQQHLFEQFYRAANVQHSSFTGLGIGLYIVREIVQQHGGMISCTSQEGQGTTFTICLPLSDHN